MGRYSPDSRFPRQALLLEGEGLSFAFKNSLCGQIGLDKYLISLSIIPGFSDLNYRGKKHLRKVNAAGPPGLL
jgi:hypothetical protein